MHRQYKVLHIITRLDRGGSAINTLSTCAGLAEKGYHVSLVKGLSLESEMSESEQRATDLAVREAENRGVVMITYARLVRRIHPLFDFLIFAQIFFLILREKYDIVHTHTSKAGILGRWAAFFAGTPIIIHTPHGHVFTGYFGKWKSGLFVFLEKVSAFISKSIITLTDKCLQDMLDYKIAKREKFRTIHSGIPVDRFLSFNKEAAKKNKAELGVSPDSLVVGSVGRLVPVKAYDQFIQAASLIRKEEPETVFLILGEGPLREELLSLAERLNLGPYIFLPGWKTDPENWLGLMDVFLLTSRNEGMGRVIVEAMACGKPVVATDVGGVSSLLDESTTGFLVPSETPEVMAEKVVTLLRDPELRKSLGENGREKAKTLGTQAMVDQIDDLYKEWTRNE